MGSRTGAMETLLIGIDAACAGVVNPLVSAESLPNLESIFDTGVRQPLASQIPPWTPSAWPSMYTGVNPGKHGVFGFLSYEGYDWDVVTFDDVGELTIWEILSLRGKSSVVVNVPVTHPPSEFDGAIVPGYIAPDPPKTHPSDVLDRFVDEYGPYRVYPDPDHDPHEAYPALVRSRGDVFCYLADAFDPAFGFVQFQATDSIFHESPNDQELVERVYRAVDEQIGRLCERYQPETIIVASDHGMGRYDRYEFRVNEFLRRQGRLQPTRGQRGMPAWLPILDDSLRQRDTAVETLDPALATRAVTLVARLGLTPARAGRLLRALGIADLVSSRLPATAKRAGTTQVDFPASVAYMRSRVELGVRMNVVGREPDGVVPVDEYEAVRDDLVDALSEVRTPDGGPVFEDVAPRAEYFWGPYVDDAVDIITVPHSFEQFLSADLKGSEFGDPSEPWNHKLDGLVAMTGAQVDPTARLSSPHVFDIAPTVLASMNVPVSDRMDGTVLGSIRPTTEATYPLADRDASSSRSVGDVEERLEAIGYL